MSEWSSSYVTALPDSAFACPESRKYPHHNKAGAVDLPHLRAALSRVGDPSNDQCGKGHLQRHARSLGMGQARKANVIDDDAISVLSIPYGGPIPSPHYAKGMDLDGQFFTENTDIKPDWFDQRPVLWFHGQDPAMGQTLFGKAVNLRQDEDGWWTDVWFKAGERRKELIRRLSEMGAEIYGSSQSIPALARVAKSGEILVWPFIEQTLSTVVQNTYSVTRPMKAVMDDFEQAEISLSSGLTSLLDSLTQYATDLSAKAGETSLDLRATERNQDVMAALNELEAGIQRFARTAER